MDSEFKMLKKGWGRVLQETSGVIDTLFTDDPVLFIGLETWAFSGHRNDNDCGDHLV